MDTENNQSVENLDSVQYTKEDIDNNKVMAILAYILFFIPLLAAKDSPYAKYHANQGLILFIAAAAVSIAGTIPLIGWLVILPIGSLIVFVLAILGIINASQGKAKPLPLIGSFNIIK